MKKTKNYPTKQKSNSLKIIGIITMLIDHIGAYLFPFPLFRLIGRIAFPIFAYQTAVSFNFTKNKYIYFYSLLSVAILGQIPIFLLKGSLILNFVFSLALGVLMLILLEEKKYFLFFVAFPLAFFCDYGVYGLLSILSFALIKEKKYQILSFFILTFLFSFYYNVYIQLFSLIALFFIYFDFEFNFSIKNKMFFYYFYPLHLFLIWLISRFVLGY
jgi:hypothetical protein